MDQLYDRLTYMKFDRGETIGSARHELYIIASGAVEVNIKGNSMLEAVTANVLHRGNTIGSLTEHSPKRAASFVAASGPADAGTSAAIIAILC